jgi:hypothetical protein
LTPVLAIAVLQAAAAAGPPPVTHASADDCAIIVAIGKAELGWGADSSSDWPFFPDYDLPGGGSYVEDCPWRTLGVAPPTIGSPASMRGAAIARPAYGSDRVTATADITTTISEQDASGRPLPPFIQDRVCKLERRGTTWMLLSCDTTAMT